MSTKKQANTLSNKYKKYEHKEHVLKRPDSYVGSIEEHNESIHVIEYNDEEKYITQKKITYIPALYKIFDEILVNAIDQHTRLKQESTKNKKKKLKQVSKIDVSINAEENSIEVVNDGEGIEIVKMEEHNMYPPELIFGCLLTSSNYDDNEKKVTGGKNGYGAKLANIFSEKFIVETVDHRRKLKYYQEFYNNMSKRGEPIIEKYTGAPFTRIQFFPDLKQFHKKALNDNNDLDLMEKRVYDAAAWTDKNVTVTLNGNIIHENDFVKYTNLYLGNSKPRAYEKCNMNWEIVATYNSDEMFEQVSFVNGINTIRGGKHVEYIVNQIQTKLVEYIQKKYKLAVKPIYVRNQLMVFVKSSIINPSFDGQTKETLTTAKSKFGSTCEISTKFIQSLADTGIVDRIILQAQYKESKEFKKTDGKKVSTLRGIPKLTDANKAGTKHSKKCTLILTEGDSAKSMAIAGLRQEDRDYFGVYPLRGKVRNVQELKMEDIVKNQEICELKKIIGLRAGEDYSKDFNVWPLRYGKIMIMTDQDTDGSHIKGLIMNLFHLFWPSLLEIDFITSLITPIVKVSKGKKKILSFYTLTEYEDWKKKNKDGKGWHIKYYKGLGTSTSKEAKEYFTNLKQVQYQMTQKSSDALDLAFNKKRTDDRKTWLKQYDKASILDSNNMEVPYEEFIHKEFKHFSNYDVHRSIPNICDGFKPSQRKVMFACFKRNLVKEIKVSQLSGYVSEHTCYHHGETSLQGTIIKLAQTFVGSNNINYLKPNGQFGTRILGGKDSASPRYIFTELNPLTKILFNHKDFPILNYLNDDGTMIEPEWYMPVMPTILINGASGIGTGYSTDLPNFNPIDIIKCMEAKLKGLDYPEIKPWYNNFKGTIEKISDNKYISKGCYRKVGSSKIEITELPIGMWTDDYKKFLEGLLEDKSVSKKGKGKQKAKAKKHILREFNDNSTETDIHFQLVFSPIDLMRLLKGNADKNGITPFEKMFKLTSSVNLTNMHLFRPDGIIQKYNDVYEIIDDFCDIRLEFYSKRKAYILDHIKKELNLLFYKVKFINEIISDTIDLRKKKRVVINDILHKKGYPELNNNISSTELSYDYLVRMPLDTLTEEKVEELEKKLKKLQNEFDELQAKSEKKLWVEDLRNVYKMVKKTIIVNNSMKAIKSSKKPKNAK